MEKCIEEKEIRQYVPGSSSMMLRASMAAAASMGGREAEKQYPWPDSRYNTQTYFFTFYCITVDVIRINILTLITLEKNNTFTLS